jgi:ABC-type multidrug transport system fused ATPase/permease subunit
MEHSRSKGYIGLAAALVALDLVARLSLPVALLALAHGHANGALAASVAVTTASALRSVLFGWSVERAITDKWHRFIEATGRKNPSDIKNRPQEREGLVRLIESVREAAFHDAQAMPHLIALFVALFALVIAVFVLLGPVWLLIGGVTALIVGGFVVLGQRKVRRATEQGFRRFGTVARDVLVLFEASLELRAHGREEAFRAELLRLIDSMARDERRATAWSAVSGLLPAGIAVLTVAAPVRAGTRSLLDGMGMLRIADVGILGSAALVTGFGFARALEDAIRSGPYRRALAAFLTPPAAAPSGRRGHGTGTPPPALTSAEIRFEAVSCVHPGAEHATPKGVDQRWTGPQGLALSGDNGAGKSTLLLALLGLIEPIEGRIWIGDVPLDAIDLSAYRRRITYIPQGAFTAPGESVAWHLRLLAGADLSDDRLDSALAKVGLLPALMAHAARGDGDDAASTLGRAPRDVLAGELSGGERQRMHLARAFLNDAELILLDEPEVGLDEAGRRALRGLLEELAARRRVLVIAHDASIVPASFARLRCARGPWGTGSAAPLPASNLKPERDRGALRRP